MNEVQVLHGAIDELREHGWCRDELENAAGNVCFAGAINTALHGHAQWCVRDPVLDDWHSDYACFLAINERFRTLFASPKDNAYSHVITWNNEEAQDVDEVIERMKLLAESFEVDPA